MKTIEIKLPIGFMNVTITEDNCLTSNNNNINDWNDLKFPLPEGKWKVKEINVNENIVTLKKEIHRMMKSPDERYGGC